MTTTMIVLAITCLLLIISGVIVVKQKKLYAFSCMILLLSGVNAIKLHYWLLSQVSWIDKIMGKTTFPLNPMNFLLTTFVVVSFLWSLITLTKILLSDIGGNSK